jgi:hypothetical protein
VGGDKAVSPFGGGGARIAVPRGVHERPEPARRAVLTAGSGEKEMMHGAAERITSFGIAFSSYGMQAIAYRGTVPASGALHLAQCAFACSLSMIRTDGLPGHEVQISCGEQHVLSG